MSEEVKNFKCPSCDAPLRYDSESGKLKCDYCGSEYEPEMFETAGEPIPDIPGQDSSEFSETRGQWSDADSGSDWGDDAGGMRSYVCPSCGAELICDESTAATACPYCGNPAVIPGQFSGSSRKPDYVLPFKISKAEAEKALKEHYKKKILLPKVFSKENHIKEIKGVYVPFWLFDAASRGNAYFDCSNSTTHREGDYIVTRTRHYSVYRAGSMSFERVPVDGSSKMPDDYMDSIEPYDYGELKDFTTVYLPGYMADKYDVDADAASERAELRFKNSFTDALRDTVSGYEIVTPRGGHYDMQPGRVGYALMPVWLLSTKWHDKTYLFAVNGQTGKMVGDLPVDEKKRRLWFWGSFAALGAVLSAILSGPFGRMFFNFFN